MQRTHLLRERGLIADGGGHAPEERRNFAARLHEAEDVVDEEEHVLILAVAEVFRHREPRERRAHPHAGRFVHLPEDERRLIEDPALLHFQPEVVALAAALADAREDGIPAVLRRDVVDELLDEHRLADARTAEEADLTALCVGFQKIDDLDARFEQLHGGRLLFEGGRAAVDGPTLFRFNRLAAVDGLAEDVEHPAERPLAHGHFDGTALGNHFHAAGEPFAAAQHDAADGVPFDVPRRLHDELSSARPDGERFTDARKFALFECDVDDGALDAHDDAFCHMLSPFCAAAPAETSVISCVIAPWRT